MRRPLSFSLIVMLLVTGPAQAADDLLTVARARFQPIPLKAPELPGNPATPAQLELGRMLYFDPRVSAGRPGSCNSCHNVGLAGADGRETAIGHSWQKGGRNVPTAFNAVFNTARFWDGRAQDLDDKAGGPPFNPIELALPRDQLSDAARRDPRLPGRLPRRVPGRARAGDAGERAEGHRGLPGHADHPERALRQVPAGRRLRAQREAEGRSAALHQQRLRRVPRRHEPGWHAVRAVRHPGKAGRRRAAPGRQGPLHGDGNRGRPVRLQGPAAAEHRADRALLPFRQGLGPGPVGGGNGREPDRRAGERRGKRADHRVPREPDGGAAAGYVPGAAGCSRPRACCPRRG